MYKLLIACASLAVVAAAPGYLGAPIAAPGYLGGYAHGPVLGAPIAAPYISAPVVKTALPVATSYANTYKVSAPLAYAAPAPVAYAPHAPVAYAAHAPVLAPSPLLAHAW